MSNPTRNADTVTGLLLQKPKAFAELDENSRIAISILQDDGWKVSRVGAELSVDFTITAQPVERPGLDQALADAETRYVALRNEFVKLGDEMVRIRRRAWLAAAAGCLLCSTLTFFHVPVLMTPLGAACVLAWRFRGYRKAKGAA